MTAHKQCTRSLIGIAFAESRPPIASHIVEPLFSDGSRLPLLSCHDGLASLGEVLLIRHELLLQCSALVMLRACYAFGSFSCCALKLSHVSMNIASIGLPK